MNLKVVVLGSRLSIAPLRSGSSSTDAGIPPKTGPASPVAGRVYRRLGCDASLIPGRKKEWSVSTALLAANHVEPHVDTGLCAWRGVLAAPEGRPHPRIRHAGRSWRICSATVRHQGPPRCTSRRLGQCPCGRPHTSRPHRSESRTLDDTHARAFLWIPRTLSISMLLRSWMTRSCHCMRSFSKLCLRRHLIPTHKPVHWSSSTAYPCCSGA